MKNNLGVTRMHTRKRLKNNLSDFDCLPKNLRQWLCNASLPWSAKSAQRIYNRVLIDTGNTYLAIEELNKMQKKHLKKYKLI